MANMTQEKLEEKRARQREYTRRYKERHPERFKAKQALANEKWRKNNPEKVREMWKKQKEKDPEKHAGYVKAWREANMDRVRASNRRSKGLPEPTRPCPDVCECCGCPPRGFSPSANTLHLDHCHETGVFRGWLCGSCNIAIGHLGDNIEGVKRALAYLEQAAGVVG